MNQYNRNVISNAFLAYFGSLRVVLPVTQEFTVSGLNQSNFTRT